MKCCRTYINCKLTTVKGRILDRPLLTGYIASVAEIYQQRNTDISIYDKDTGYGTIVCYLDVTHHILQIERTNVPLE
jgi:hypothetical protein